MKKSGKQLFQVQYCVPLNSYHNFLYLILVFSLFFLAMPELMRSAKLAVEKGLAQGRNETYIKQLSDYIVPALVEALHKVGPSAEIL